MNAKDFLNKAVKEQEERANYYNSPDGERSMDTATAIFNAWTGHNLSTADGWRFMIALKQAREVQGKKSDNYVDLAGYASLLGEEVCGSGSGVQKETDNLEKPLKQGLDTRDWATSQFQRDQKHIYFASDRADSEKYEEGFLRELRRQGAEIKTGELAHKYNV